MGFDLLCLAEGENLRPKKKPRGWLAAFSPAEAGQETKVRWFGCFFSLVWGPFRVICVLQQVARGR